MRRKSMRPSFLNLALKRAALTLTILLLAAGASFAQTTVNLTATSQSTTLPDDNTVPMWGWVCGTGTATTLGGTGTPAPAGGATCTAMNGAQQAPGTVANPAANPPIAGSMSTTWQPPLITVPPQAGQPPFGFLVNLSNYLPVAPPTSS